MTEKIIGYFCGPGSTCESDKHYQHIKKLLQDNIILLGYDGDRSKLRWYEYTVEYQTDLFIADLKAEFRARFRNNRALDPDTKFQLNLIAASEGELAMFLAIRKIQQDPEIKDRVDVILDFHDPIAANARTSASNDTSVETSYGSFVDCPFIKQVYVTLHETPKSSVSRALIPTFNEETGVDIEVLPNDFSESFVHTKSAAILAAHEHEMTGGNLAHEQLTLYNQMVTLAKARQDAFNERSLNRWGSKTVANNQAKKEQINAVNWHHVQLLKQAGQLNSQPHVLYGLAHPEYHYKKQPMERACDVFQALDAFQEQSLQDRALKESLVQNTNQLLQGVISDKDYRDRCQTLLKQENCQEQRLIRAVLHLAAESYLEEIKVLYKQQMASQSILANDLSKLIQSLSRELHAQIDNGKGFESLEKDSATIIGHNTVDLLNKLNSKSYSLKETLSLVEQYAKENISLGRNWRTGTKVFLGIVLCLCTTILGCMIGAAIGLGIGLAAGVGAKALIVGFITPILSELQTFVLLMGGGGAAVGLGMGIIASHSLFTPSRTEKNIQALVGAVEEQIQAANPPSP